MQCWGFAGHTKAKLAVLPSVPFLKGGQLGRVGADRAARGKLGRTPGFGLKYTLTGWHWRAPFAGRVLRCVLS